MLNYFAGDEDLPALKIDLSKYDKTYTIVQNNTNGNGMNEMVNQYLTLLPKSKDSYKVMTDTDMNKYVLDAVSVT